MLKNNIGYHNDPRMFLTEMNCDISILDPPSRIAQKYNSSRYDKFILNETRKIKENPSTLSTTNGILI